jgi:hypothetical protein
MKLLIVCLSMIVVTCSSFGIDPGCKAAYWATQNGATITPDGPVRFDGRYVTSNGVAVADVQTIQDADVEAWDAARRAYPSPDSLAPLVDANGAVVGMARIVVNASSLEPVAVVDSASPQRPWAEQQAAIRGRIAARKAAREAAGKAKNAAANANSVAALRAQVAELARIIEELSK